MTTAMTTAMTTTMTMTAVIVIVIVIVVILSLAVGQRDIESFPAVEIETIPEIRLRAADAAMSGHHGKTGALIPFDRGTGVMRDRPFTAELDQAAPTAGRGIIEGAC
jgi:hypothetical protein